MIALYIFEACRLEFELIEQNQSGFEKGEGLKDRSVWQVNKVALTFHRHFDHVDSEMLTLSV